MSYFMDAKATSLAALRDRLQGTDLIPSQQPLLEDIVENFAVLEKAGIRNLAELRATLKASETLTALSKNSGVSEDYLLLLRRTINGFLPKPRPFKKMDWLNKPVVDALQQAGLKNTQQLFETNAAELFDTLSLDREIITELVAISDLCRVQWVSPNYARALVAAGFGTSSKIARADPDALVAALEKANQHEEFYNGKVGLRDIRRLVTAAKYVA